MFVEALIEQISPCLIELDLGFSICNLHNDYLYIHPFLKKLNGSDGEIFLCHLNCFNQFFLKL